MESGIKSQEIQASQGGTRDELHSLALDLAGKDVWSRERARHAFIQLGDAAVSFLTEMLPDGNTTLRWEIVRIFVEMEDPASIPGLIDSLEDPVSSIRWLAIEGLIKIGPPVVLPLLEALMNSPGSAGIRDGAYQVFLALHKSQAAKRNALPINTLENYTPPEKVPVIADRIDSEL